MQGLSSATLLDAEDGVQGLSSATLLDAEDGEIYCKVGNPELRIRIRFSGGSNLGFKFFLIIIEPEDFNIFVTKFFKKWDKYYLRGRIQIRFFFSIPGGWIRIFGGSEPNPNLMEDLIGVSLCPDLQPWKGLKIVPNPKFYF